MPIVTISRGSYSRGREVAEKVAQKLGYECVSREILVEASEEFDVPEVRLLHAIQDAPSVLDRFTFGKERYVAFIQAALLEHFQKDNVVYHGLAGQYFINDVSHVLKVRIIAETDDRVGLVMQREALAEDKALRVLKDIDEARRKWGLYLYGIDPDDSSLYDLVIHIKKLSVDDAADLIHQTIRLEAFKTTAESQRALDDLTLAARVKANIIERHHRVNVNVAAHDGLVYIGLEGTGAHEEAKLRDAVEGLPGVRSVEVNMYPFMTPD
jgi:cytidylate kinase